MTILHTLQQGDHILVCDDVYGGTQRYMRKFFGDKHNLQADFADISDTENVIKGLRKDTKIVWIETPTNPTMKLVDINEVATAAKKFNPEIIVVCDNTFASPYITNPLLLGADIAYHSITKYIGGHSDIVMGALVFKDKALHDKCFYAAASIGACPSPFDCFMAMRGLKTLEQRVITATKNAFHVAHFLEKHPTVEATIYPGLKSNKHHERAKKQMRGFGGMVSFRIKGAREQTSKFLKAMKVFTLAESLGGVESLAQCPALMTHASVPEDVRKELGITETLVRVSVGVESLDDLIADLDQAL